jgi:hypothetical protein
VEIVAVQQILKLVTDEPVAVGNFSKKSTEALNQLQRNTDKPHQSSQKVVFTIYDKDYTESQAREFISTSSATMPS